MKLFKCQACGQLLYFENTRCEKCGHAVGYDPGKFQLLAVEPAPASGASGEVFRSVDAEGALYRFCANRDHGVCNWLIRAEKLDAYCLCCRHNRTVPDTTLPDNLLHWRKIEVAKHRLFYSLTRLGLPLEPSGAPNSRALTFNFLADADPARRVMTGHADGRITIALAEADDAERERRRVDLHEPYRTLLGHFRHEVGHYYWDRLVRDEPRRLDAFRAMFGDERADYTAALQRHYETGPPPDWQSRSVSSYATSHPWEDFAETWAHYLHIVDTLEIAGAFEMSVHPRLMRSDALDVTVDFNAYNSASVEQIVETWLPLSLALNSLNRAMGQPDLYPFLLSPGAIEKLGFIHALVHADNAPPT